MGRHQAVGTLSLLAGLAVVGLSVFGFLGLLDRPAIPWDELAQQTGVPAEDLPAAAVRANGFPVRDTDADFKFITARHRIGDEIDFVFLEDGREVAARAALSAHYAGEGFPLIYLLTGGFGFLIGFSVAFLRPDDRRARLFYWLCLAFSSAVMINGEWYGVQGRPLAVLPGVLFFFAYILTPVVFLRFSVTFTPREHLAGGRPLFGLSLAFGVFFSAVFAASILLPSIDLFRWKSYFRVFRVFFVLLFLASAVVLVRAYRHALSRDRREQIRWILYGIVAGLGPFLFLYQVPRAFGASGLVPEETASAFFVLLPVALALAIFRYRLLDVHVIVNKSLVYSLLTVVVVGVYMLSIEGLKQLVTVRTGTGRKWLSTAAAFIAAVAFAPARSWIQSLVDRAFFRRGYDHRKAVLGFAEAAERTFDAEGLLDLLADTLDKTLPVEKLGAVVPAPAAGMFGAALLRGVGPEAAGRLLAGAAETAPAVDGAELARLGFESALPLPLAQGDRTGWVLLGPKRSGLELTGEDRELLGSLAVELGAALRRVRLREEVVYERATREKLEELGRMKTEFISSVSHELRTPMASLQSITELLRSKRVAEPARRERLLELMAAECGRLGRYLRNVLDFGRIEQDAKSYEIRETDLGPVVAGVADVVRSAATDDGLELSVDLPDGPVRVEADADAVRQALHNLIDNAVKYGGARKRVSVRLARTAAGAEISVVDEGIGIAAADLGRIFEAFFRAPEAVRHDPKGVGLGLMIVKHVMDAHGGTVAVASEPGRGTTFTLMFPERGSP